MSSPEVVEQEPETRSADTNEVLRRVLRTATWQGFIGSLCLLLASFGIGWLASSSSLIRTPLLILARTTPTSVIICTVLACLGALLMFRAWVALRPVVRQPTAGLSKSLRWTLALWTVPMMFALPLFSRDSYAYIGQGRLMQQGLDPYTNGISALFNYFNLGPDALWTEAPTPYGPVWLWIEQGAVALANGSPELTLIPFRLASLLGVILLAVYVPKTAQHFGFNPDRALWLVVLNPMVLINFIGSVHNDSLMLGLVVFGIYCAAKKRPVLAIVLVTLSIAIKPITLIALPFIGLIWAGSKAGWIRKFGIWAATLAISMALMAFMGWINDLGFGWLAALQTPGTVWIWYAPFGLLSNTVGFVVTLLGGSGAGVTSVIQGIGQAGSILVVVALMLMRIKPMPNSHLDAAGKNVALDSDNAYALAVVRRMAWAFSAVVLMAPMIQPWYMCWLLAFFAMTGIKEGWPTRLVLFGTLFFILIALTDQISVFQWIPIVLVRTIAIACSVAGALWLTLGDKKTRGHFRAEPQLTD